MRYGFFKAPVRSTDVLMGAGVGLIGAGALKYVWDKIPVVGTMPMAAKLAPLVGAGLAGGIAYYAQGGKGRAAGHLTGALTVGGSMTVWGFLKEQFPQLSDVVELRYNGLLVDDRARAMNGYGLLTSDSNNPALNGYADNPAMAGLAAMSMGTDDDGQGDLFDLQ